MRWSRATSYQRSPLDALDDASTALAVALDGAPAHLVVAFVDGAFRGKAAALGQAIERRHRGALSLVVPVPSLGLPLPDEEVPRLALHALSAPGVRLLPWRCDPRSGRLEFPLIPGPLGLLLFADGSSLDVDRATSELAARCDAVAGFALHDMPTPWPLAVGQELVEGGAVGVYCDDPTFAEAWAFPMARPVGPARIVTSGLAGRVEALDGRPALDVLEEWARALTDAEKESLASGLDVALDLRVRGVHSDEGDLATCRMLALDRDRGAFVVDADTQPFQVLRFAARNDAHAVEAAVREAARDEGAILLWPVEASPMAHWPDDAALRKSELARSAIRGAVPLVGARHASQPVHRHALGVLRLR